MQLERWLDECIQFDGWMEGGRSVATIVIESMEEAGEGSIEEAWEGSSPEQTATKFEVECEMPSQTWTLRRPKFEIKIHYQQLTSIRRTHSLTSGMPLGHSRRSSMSASEVSLLLTYSKACFSTNITMLIQENPCTKSSEPTVTCVWQQASTCVRAAAHDVGSSRPGYPGRNCSTQ